MENPRQKTGQAGEEVAHRNWELFVIGRFITTLGPPPRITALLFCVDRFRHLLRASCKGNGQGRSSRNGPGANSRAVLGLFCGPMRIFPFPSSGVPVY